MELVHRFRDCSCPGTPHPDGDTVTFPKQLPFDVMARVIGAIWGRDDSLPTAQNAFNVYLYEAPVAWNLIDAEQDPVPLNHDAIAALSFADQYEIADHADTLYRDTVLSPLVRRMSKPSETGPTGASSKTRSRR